MYVRACIKLLHSSSLVAFSLLHNILCNKCMNANRVMYFGCFLCF